MTEQQNPGARGLSRAIEDATRRLADAGVPSPSVDAELLCAHVLGETRGGVRMRRLLGEALTPDEAQALDAAVRRRVVREPLQHITGAAAFRHLTLEVGPGVFVPRPETEVLAGIAIDALRAVPEAERLAVDLCAGSGAIALALATEVPGARVIAAERSVDALPYLKRNIEAHAPGVEVREGDIRYTLDDLAGTVAVIATNPPYVPRGAVPDDPEVHAADPEAALYSGEDGLDLIRDIAPLAARLGRPGALVIVEHTEEQGAAVARLLERAGFSGVRTATDLTARPRMTLGRLGAARADATLATGPSVSARGQDASLETPA